MGKRSELQGTYLRLLRQELTPDEAVCALALLYGLRLQPSQHWTLEQLEALLFLRYVEEREHPEHLHGDPGE
jgi:hypothetical protein